MDLVEDVELRGKNDVELALEYKEDYEAIQGILATKAKEEQQIVRLKLFQEYTFREIAELIQIPEATVKTKYYRAIRQVRKEMESYYNAN